MNTNFSWKERNTWIQEIPNEKYDLLIIGGGITGAGILLDAQSRGLKALVVDMQDFAAGTSSRSTKLIHGGLRYLKNLEFKLVAEVGRERAIVYENGPHVTRAEPMLIPIIENGSLGKLSTSLGVWLYDRLAGVSKKERRRVLSAEETAIAEPLLNKKILKAGVLYYEYRTDDARLTIEVIKKAVELGAKAINYSKVVSLNYNHGKITGAKIKDLISDKEFDINASYVVNATGPWVDDIMAMDDKSKAGKLFVTKGVHLVVDHQKFPVRQSAYFDTDDGRMIFVIPRDDKTYFGTTDTEYHSDIKNPKIEKSDVQYLIRSVNRIFEGLNLKESDVLSGWAGLRPLIRQEGKSPSEISRKDEVFINESGLISIAGGKLTGFRTMAMKIVDIVASKIKSSQHWKPKKCNTEHITLSGGDIGGSSKFHSFVSKMEQLGKELELSAEDSLTISKVYGSNAKKLFEIAVKGKEIAGNFGLPLIIYTRLVYAIENEMAISPSDFLIRRSSMLYFHPVELEQYKEQVIGFMKSRLQWSQSVETDFRNDLNLQISLDRNIL